MIGRNLAGWTRAGAGALVLAVILAGAGISGPACANPFTPVISVNDRVITRYELDQRILFMQLLRQPGDIEEQARTGLIEDRLRLVAGEEFAIKLTPEQVLGGMTEFASRANLTAEQFVEALGQGGVQAETFRDFVEAGMIWREVVRAKFAGRVTITEAEIDRALANFKPTTAVKVNLSQIAIPAKGADRSGALAMARRLKGQIVTEADFVAAAREVSSQQTRLGWQRLSALPEAAIAEVRGMAVGQVSDPVVLDEEVALYWLHEQGEDALGAGTGLVVDYAQFLVPEGPEAAAELAAVRARVDTCNDLYALGKGLPAERLLRDSKAQGEVPRDIADVLATLDTGESSTRLVRGGWRVFVMLCGRGAAADLMPDRASVGTQLLNQRLGGLADIYMEELRSEAIITGQ